MQSVPTTHIDTIIVGKQVSRLGTTRVSTEVKRKVAKESTERIALIHIDQSRLKGFECQDSYNICNAEKTSQPTNQQATKSNTYCKYCDKLCVFRCLYTHFAFIPNVTRDCSVVRFYSSSYYLPFFSPLLILNQQRNIFGGR